MKTGRTRYTSGIGRTLLGALALVAIVALGTPQAANASTAANAQIVNTVSVAYDNTAGLGMTPVEATVTVTVLLVPSAPTAELSDATLGNAQGTDVYTLETTAETLYYSVTSGANGPDDYTLSNTITESGVGNESSVSLTPAGPITLGGTLASAAASIGASTITVPYDGNYDTDATKTNEIAANDYVVIGGNTYQVDSITENAGSNSTTITLTSNLTTAVSIGDQIGERMEIALAMTTGTLTTPPVEGTHSATLTATNSNTDTDTSAAVTVHVQRPQLSVTKEVSTDGGANFGGDTTADTGDTLTYRITVTNDGSSDADSVVITDPRPDFTTYVPESAKYRDATGVYAGATVLDDDTAGAPDDGYDWTGNTATFSVGTLAPAAVKVLFYQVTID